MQEIFRYIRKHEMIREKDRIVVGVSGGADSVCLLYVLLEYQKQMDFSIEVVHVEHGIRGEESRKDAAFVEELCRSWKVPYVCYPVDIPAIAKEEKLTVEEAGRMMRYRIFEDYRKASDCNKIAVAHHQNDQAETMLWNMIRGSGLKGSCGIHPVRGEVIRPLLACKRKRIEEILTEKGITWREDATNQEEEYTRNLLRRQIIPLMEEKLNSAVVEHLFHLSEEMQETESYLQKMSQEAFLECVRIKEKEALITIDSFQKLELLIQKRIIRLCLEKIGCGLKDITREHIEMIRLAAEMESGKWVSLPGGWCAQREFSVLAIRRNVEKEKQAAIPLVIEGETKLKNGRVITRVFSYENQQIPQKRYTKWLNYDIIKDSLVIRTRESGDYLVINSQGGHKKLKSYFTEEKIPVSERDDIPLLCAGQEVLWVMGYRIGETGKVVPATRQILEIIYQEDR